MSPLHRHGRDTEAGQQRRVFSQRYSISLTLSATRREAEASGVGGGKGFTRLRSGWAVPDSRACLLVSPGVFFAFPCYIYLLHST